MIEQVHADLKNGEIRQGHHGYDPGQTHLRCCPVARREGAGHRIKGAHSVRTLDSASGGPVCSGYKLIDTACPESDQKNTSTTSIKPSSLVS